MRQQQLTMVSFAAAVWATLVTLCSHRTSAAVIPTSGSSETKTVTVTNGYVGQRFVGIHTSQITAAVLPMFPLVTPQDWVSEGRYHSLHAATIHLVHNVQHRCDSLHD